MVSVSESISQKVEDLVVKVPNWLIVISTKTTNMSENKYLKKSWIWFFFGQFGCLFWQFSMYILNTKSNIYHKLKIGKFLFHRFQNIAQLFETKSKYDKFPIWPLLSGRWICMSLLGTGPSISAQKLIICKTYRINDCKIQAI